MLAVVRVTHGQGLASQDDSFGALRNLRDESRSGVREQQADAGAGACGSVLRLSHASQARLTHHLQLASIAAEHGEPALRSGHLEAIEKILQVKHLLRICV